VLELLARKAFVKGVRLQPLLRNIVVTLNIESTVDFGRAATEIPKTIYKPD
jgi:hypothetical protein